MGGKNSTSTSTVSIPPEVLARYNAVNKQAESVAATPFQKYGTQASDFVAQMNSQQGKGISGINNIADAGPIYNNIDKYMNPFTKNVADTTRAQMEQSQEQAQSGALGTAVSSGAFGGDRAGVAAANLANQNQMAMGSTMANIYNQGYTQAVDTSMQDANRMLGVAGQQVATGTMQQQTEQAGKDALINQFMQEKGYPFQVAQFLANIAMGTGAASGSTTTTTQPLGIFGNLATGGRVERADGGGVAGPRTFSETPVGGVGYVPAGDLPVMKLLMANPPDQKNSSNADTILKLAQMIPMNTGGVVGDRHGYATDGYVGPESPEEAYAKYLRSKKSVPDYREALLAQGLTNGTDAVSQLMPPSTPQRTSAILQGPAETPSLGSVSQIPSPPRETTPQSVILQKPAETPSLGSVPQIPSPPREGGLSPAASMRPPVRPQGLAGADVAADTMTALGRNASAAPVAPAANGAEDPIAFYNTKIIRQESGGKQLNADGTPLTSSKGAVGVGQVMEATGPEAAKLAGLPWDRNRWMYDKDYNKAIGQAYFLDQYRKFGSLDKAAAAYNAGPGRLAQAMDRANALGGSYTDYLPSETQNYVKSTTGIGGSGVAGSGTQSAPQVTFGGLAGADTQGGDKAYADRNAIGKFFHNETGQGLNPIALKSILGGLASMAKTNTVSPISALLQGVGGGMETYNRLQNEEPKRVADIMANSKNAILQYQTAVAMGEKRPFEQWATAQFGSGPASMVGSPDGKSLSQPQLSQADIMGKSLSQEITLPNGVVVQGGQNYAHLTKLANDLQPYVAANVPAAVATMEAVQARLNDIRTQQGFVQDVNGQQVKDPTYTATLDAQSRTGFGREQTLEFDKKANTERKRVDQDLAMIDHQADVFTQFPAGALASDKAAGLAVLQSLGLPVPEDTSEYASKAQEALKGAAQKLLNSLSTDAPAAEMAQLKMAIESPNMEPEAVKTILSLQKAQALRDKDYYMLRPQWNATYPENAMDQSAYETWFADQHGFQKYFEEAKKSMPIFAGELGSMQRPHPIGASYSDIGAGQYFTLPDGKIGQREE